MGRRGRHTACGFTLFPQRKTCETASGAAGPLDVRGDPRDRPIAPFFGTSSIFSTYLL